MPRVAVRAQPYSNVGDLHVVCCLLNEGTGMKEVYGNRRSRRCTGCGVRKIAWTYVVLGGPSRGTDPDRITALVAGKPAPTTGSLQTQLKAPILTNNLHRDRSLCVTVPKPVFYPIHSS